MAILGELQSAAIGQKKHGGKLSKLQKKEALWGLLFLSPWITGFVLLYLFPMIASFIFSRISGRLAMLSVASQASCT